MIFGGKNLPIDRKSQQNDAVVAGRWMEENLDLFCVARRSRQTRRFDAAKTRDDHERRKSGVSRSHVHWRTDFHVLLNARSCVEVGSVGGRCVGLGGCCGGSSPPPPPPCIIVV